MSEWLVLKISLIHSEADARGERNYTSFHLHRLSLSLSLSELVLALVCLTDLH